jgi:hypothetical protein
VVQVEVYASDDLTREPTMKRRKCGKIYLRADENLHDLAALAGRNVTGPNDPGGIYIATSLDTLEQISFDDMTETASRLEAPTEDGGYRQWKLMVYITSKRGSGGEWKKLQPTKGT